MKKPSSVIALLLLFLVLGGCASALVSDIKVNAEVTPGYVPSEYKTYSWLGTAQIVSDPEGNWEQPQFDADAQIKLFIDREMRARGIGEVPAHPNIFVGFVAGVDMDRLELTQDPRQQLDVLKSVPKGALVVMLIDAASGSTVWAAAAVGHIEAGRSEEDSKARLDYAVRQMFKKLPDRAPTDKDSPY